VFESLADWACDLEEGVLDCDEVLALEVDLGFEALFDESLDDVFWVELDWELLEEEGLVLDVLLLLVAERLSEKMSGLWVDELERWVLDEEELDEELPILSATCHQSV
jgi:hypothetical protein